MQPRCDIDGAIAEINRQRANGESVNITQTAETFAVERSTLSRRVNSVT
jgi:hypothetical protein